MFILLVNSEDQPFLARGGLAALPSPNALCSEAIFQKAAFIRANLEGLPMGAWIGNDLTDLDWLNIVQDTFPPEEPALVIRRFSVQNWCEFI